MKKFLLQSLSIFIFCAAFLWGTNSYAQTNQAKLDTVSSKDVSKYINKVVVSSGHVATTRLIASNNMTLLNVGGEYPNQDFTIMIRNENRTKFGQPEVDLKGKTVLVKGLVIDYKGKPEIEISEPDQLKVQ